MAVAKRLAKRASIWQAVRLSGAGVVVVAGVLALASHGASAQPVACGTLPSGTSVYISCTVPPAAAPYTAYTDGEAINLSMGPNSVLASSAGADIVAIECEYTNGSGNPGDPPDDTYCDANTGPVDFPYSIHTDGSFDYVGDQGGDVANVWALPDSTFPHATISCSATQPCVWYVGEDYTNFTAPHVFSNPFFVSGQSTTSTTMPTTTTTQSSSGTTSTTSTTSPGSTTTTTSGGTGSTTTTTGVAGATSTTGAGTSATGSGGGGGGGSSGSGDVVSTSSGALAFTGQSPLLVWMMVFGLLMVAVGTGGRLVLRQAPA